jgi:hypothetical protein
LQAALALTRRIALEALERGTYAAMTADMLSVGDANGLFARPSRLDLVAAESSSTAA